MIHMDLYERIDEMYRRLLKSHPEYKIYYSTPKRNVILFAIGDGIPVSEIFATCLDQAEIAMHRGDCHCFDFTPHGFGEPTQARPGSAEKIDVLAQRVAAGLELWHPADPVLRHKIRGSVDKVPARGKIHYANQD